MVTSFYQRIGERRPLELGWRQLAFGALCVFVLSIPCELVLLIPGVGTISHLIGFVAITIGMLAAFQRGTLRQLTFIHKVMGLFVIWAASTAIWSFEPFLTAIRVLTFAQLLAMVWLIWEFAPGLDQQLGLMKAYVLGTFVSSVSTILQYATGKAVHYERFAGAGFDPNELGLTLALSIPISYMLSIRTKRLSPWIYRTQLFLALAAIFLTASRGALIATAVALWIVPITFFSVSRMNKVVLVTLVMCGIAIAPAVVPASSWERLATIRSELNDGNLSNRTVIWNAGARQFARHPVSGVGAGAFADSVDAIVGHFRDDDKPVAHNTFLSILAENGLIGFSIFLTFYGLLVVCIMKMPADLRKLWFVMISVWTIGVLTLTWEHRKPTWLLFALVLAQASTSIPRKAGRVGRRRSSPAFQPTFASRTAAPTYFPHDANRPHYQQP